MRILWSEMMPPLIVLIKFLEGRSKSFEEVEYIRLKEAPIRFLYKVLLKGLG